MPTAARLVAAVLLAALGWGVAELIKPYLEEGRPVGAFSPLSAGAGILVGWLFTGSKLDRGIGSAAGIGLASVALLVLWVTLLLSGYEMVMRSLNRRYDGPIEALQGAVEIALIDLRAAAGLDVIATLIMGGLIVGAITNWVAARFS